MLLTTTRNAPQAQQVLTLDAVENKKYHDNNLYLPLRDVLPNDYSDMYTKDLLTESNVNSLGRPMFTERPLVDWTVNDIRSLLIIDNLKPEWNNKIPKICEKGYKVIYLPLNSNDEQIISALINSDIYKEHNFDYNFLYQTAQYTVQAARQRQLSTGIFQFEEKNNYLTKPEWRNIIENYLLNLACEAQCRIDYKKTCSYLKKKKQDQQISYKTSTSPPLNSSNTSPLLKKALLTSSSTSPDFPSCFKNSNNKPTLSKQEKHQVWVQVQTKLYRRLGLDWEADDII